MTPSKYAVLPLVLKGEWFDVISDGVKYEEYRTSKNVIRQIQRWWGRKKIEGLVAVVEFRRGYAKNAPRMAFTVYGVNFRPAGVFIHPDLGEPTDVPHYVITLGKRVNL